MPMRKVRHDGHHLDCTCLPDTRDADMKPLLCRMVHTEDRDEVSALAEELIETHRRQIEGIIGIIAKTAHLPYRNRDQISSYLWETLMLLVREKWPRDEESMASFDAMYSASSYLDLYTRERIRKDRLHDRLEGVPVVSGGPGAVRRHEELEKSRQEFIAQRGREATTTEIIIFHNARVSANRTNARKQGMIVTRADIDATQAVYFDDEDARIPDLPSHDTYDTAGKDIRSRVQTLIEACEEIDANDVRNRRPPQVPLADVARTYFAGAARGMFPSHEEIAERLGLDAEDDVQRKLVSRRMRRVKDVSRTVFEDMRQES